MGALLVALCRQEAVGRVGADHRPPEHDVGDQPVDVDRHPGRVGQGGPQLHHLGRGVGGDVGRRTHHIRQPAVGYEHDDRAPDVEGDAQPPVEPLGATLLPAVPSVVVQVEREGLEEEESRVHPHRHAEHLREVAEEGGIDGDQQEQQDAAPDRGGRIGDQQKPGELLGQLVVALLAPEDADRLGDHREHRHAQHERGEEQVHLGGDPHRGPSADDRKVSVVAPGGHLGERGLGHHQEGERAQQQERSGA